MPQHDNIAQVTKEPEGRLATVGKKRTRTGCLNCRRKRRKCDEGKPSCEGCLVRQEKCHYGLKLSFRPENAQTMDHDHPSMRKLITHRRSQSYQIVDVTSEVIRDCIEEGTSGDDEAKRGLPQGVDSDGPAHEEDVRVPSAPPSRQSRIHTVSPRTADASPFQSTPAFDLFLSPGNSESSSEDGIFVPGSQYHELYATLRSRIIDTARSSLPTRFSTPELESNVLDADVSADDDESRRLVDISPEQELMLWENYMHEVADWLDKFDNNRSFGFKLPVLAKSHPHLQYSILALSARQIERKAYSSDHSCSLALYQHAIHLLSPLLQERTTVVLASCLVLCVLEMLSCSPKAWKRHLDGCAALIQSLGINGTSEGVEGALFWCFARMDVCGGLISCERTLIPLDKWIGAGDVENDVSTLLERSDSFDVYANHMVYLCGRVIDFLCSSGRWEHRSSHRLANNMTVRETTQQWTSLFGYLDQWYQARPEEMKPLLAISSTATDPTKPFPTLLFGNGPAVSGNQMYHTAALLMLKHKPSSVQFARKPHSVLWHARQVCGISMSNSHHGCWTNSIQPLWIAGQHMSHVSEHRAILEIYERIERETGWATRWRQDDLREYWGDMDDGIPF